MKFCIFIKLFFVILFSLILSSKVFALAGFSELDSILRYNNFADINWGHPSDACRGYSPYGQYCFYLIEKNSIANPFNGALQKISIPDSLNKTFILMESTEGRWIIYDLELKGILFESDNVGLALKKWKKLGLPQIEFANAINLSNYFQETEESKEKNKISWNDFFLLLFGIIFYLHWKFWLAISLVFLLLLGVYIYERHYSSRSKFSDWSG